MSRRSFPLVSLSIALVVTLLTGCWPGASIPGTTLPSGVSGPAGTAPASRSLAFVPNRGQVDPRVLFATLGSASTLFFTRQEVLIPLPASGGGTALLDRLLGSGPPQDAPVQATPAMLQLRFEGANPGVRASGDEQLPGLVNYILGDSQAEWQTGVPTYEGLVYEQLYPGIDLVYRGSEGFLKGTYAVAPGSAPSDIRWRYDGASVEVSGGELLIHVPQGSETISLSEREPVAWQTVGDQRRPVSVRYILHRDGSIGFRVGTYDADLQLLIDPVLDYSSYAGGSGDDSGFDVAVDAAGFTYTAGRTNSLNLLTLQPTAGGYDVFVAKMDPSKTGIAQMVYLTYIGGSGDEGARGIEVDAGSNAYVVGYTESSNFPATGNAYQQSLSGSGRDAMLFRLNASGVPTYISYLGGASFDDAVQMALVDPGLVYVAGSTESSDFPTVNAFQANNLGLSDAFVSVVATTLSGAASLIYSTYYGGEGYDGAWAVDVSGTIIYLAGHMMSTDVWLVNPLQDLYAGGTDYGDLFLLTIDPAQAEPAPLFATYFGGSDDEICGGIEADGLGNAYMVGSTKSADFPRTMDPAYAGGEYDAFLVKIDTNTPSLVFSRLVGGSGNDGLRGIALEGATALAAGGDASAQAIASPDLVCAAGGTGSANIPGPMQGAFGGGSPPGQGTLGLGPGDVLVMCFNPATGEMFSGALLGGSGDEAALGIAIKGAVFVTGGTNSPNFPTQNSFQGGPGGNFDIFLTGVASLIPQAGTITIEKQASPANGTNFAFTGTLGSFSLDDALADDGDAVVNSITFVRTAGIYTVQETQAAAWRLAGITCTTNDTDDTTVVDLTGGSVDIDLDDGEDVTCTFSNVVQGGTIIVEKQVFPTGAVDAFAFAGDAAGTIGNGGQIVVSDLAPGTYTSTEADPGPDFQLTAITCDDDNSNADLTTRTATFQLDPNETVKCTFTNAQRLGTIIVEKQTLPDGAVGSFTFTGDAASTIADGGQIVVSNLDPGTYTVMEANPGAGFQLTAITCDDSDSTGSVSARTATFRLDPDETVKCTFTNAQRSVKVTKELTWPLGGPAAVNQIVRFLITIENDGGVTIDPLVLRDEYTPWCLTSRRAQTPPDAHGGSLGFLQWNDLGALTPGERTSLWVEFTAAHACQETTNRATVKTGGLSFFDEVTLRILETINRVAGFLFHDEQAGGIYRYGYEGIENRQVTATDVSLAGSGRQDKGPESSQASQANANSLSFSTGTSGWYSFNLLEPGTYHVAASAPAPSWWIPTGGEDCDAEVTTGWDLVLCHFGYWWGLDGPPVEAAAASAEKVMLWPTQDATISGWEPANQGAAGHLWVRQPGVASALLQFDLSGLSEGANITQGTLWLYSPFASNENRLYMTAYPLQPAWVEEEATWLQRTAGLDWAEPGATGDHGDPVGWSWIDGRGWAKFNLDPALLASWLADPGGNHGLLVRGEGTWNREVAYHFFSREGSNPGAQPRLVLHYTGGTGVETQAAGLFRTTTWMPLLGR